jgi:hypothetical protein
MLIRVNKDIDGLTGEARGEHIKRSSQSQLEFLVPYAIEEHWPLVAEFSFDYDATKKDEGELESYSPNVVEGASGFFRSGLNQAGRQVGRLDLTTTTRTAFAVL